jgi:Cysteine dioxygenase type I
MLPRSTRVTPSVDAASVARRLAPSVRWDGACSALEREWRLVARTPSFDAWLIAWPAGGQVALHDHGPSAGAISVIEGILTEAVPWRDETGHLSLESRELHGGTTLGFAPGHVHDVTNESDGYALSLHVYSPALTVMRRYDMMGECLVAREVCWVAASGEAADGRTMAAAASAL